MYSSMSNDIFSLRDPIYPKIFSCTTGLYLETTCGFENGVPRGGFGLGTTADTLDLLCVSMTGAPTTPWLWPGQETCTMNHLDQLTINADACPNRVFLINGNAVQVNSDTVITLDCEGTSQVIDASGAWVPAGSPVTPMTSIGCPSTNYNIIRECIVKSNPDIFQPILVPSQTQFQEVASCLTLWMLI